MKEVWIYNENNRRYHDENGVKHSTPIVRYYWGRHEIVSETSRSWVTSDGYKIPKNPEVRSKDFWASRYVVFSEEEVLERVYVQENSNKLAEAVRKLGYADLKAVEAIVSKSNKVV